MPRIDPRLITIMVSSVILSTLIVLTLIEPKEEDALLLLGNEYPEAFLKRPYSLGMDTGLSYVFMATKDFEEVELRFSSLYEKDPGVNLSMPVNPSDVPVIARLQKEVAGLGGEMEVIEASADVGDAIYDSVLIDFSRFMEAFNDDAAISSLPLVFAFLTRGGEVRYFEGSPGFFLDAEENLDYLSTACNEEKLEYFREGQMLREDAPKISEAPRDGVLVYEDVEMDDRFTVTLHFDMVEDALRHIVEWSPDTHMMELVRGYVDGKLELILLNVAGRGLKDEK